MKSKIHKTFLVVNVLLNIVFVTMGAMYLAEHHTDIIKFVTGREM
jgi:hypothetical protein